MTQQFVSQHQREVSDSPKYGAYLASIDFHLFRELKTSLGGQYFHIPKKSSRRLTDLSQHAGDNVLWRGYWKPRPPLWQMDQSLLWLCRKVTFIVLGSWLKNPFVIHTRLHFTPMQVEKKLLSDIFWIAEIIKSEEIKLWENT